MNDDVWNDKPHELRLDLPAAHSAARMARQILRQFALREGVPEKEVQTLEFVAGELLGNAVDHGGGEAALEESHLESAARMTLLFASTTEHWELRVGDQGGAEPEEVSDLLAPNEDEFPDLENERGRGFFLIKAMVDELAVEKSSDGLGLEFKTVRRYVRGE